jgi:hypothetical protein
MTTAPWYNPARWASWLSRIATSPLLGWISLATVALALSIFGVLRYHSLYFAVAGLHMEAAVLNLCTLVAASIAGRTRHLKSCWLSFAGVLLALLYTCDLWGKPFGGDLSTVVFVGLLALGFPTSLVSFLLAKVMPKLQWRLDDVIFPLAIVGLAYVQSFILLPLLFRWRAPYQSPN